MRRRNRNQSRSSLFQTLSLLLLSCLAFFTSGQIITNHDQEGMMEPSVPGIVKQKYNNNNNNNNQEQYDSSAAAAAAATIVSQKADTVFNRIVRASLTQWSDQLSGPWKHGCANSGVWSRTSLSTTQWIYLHLPWNWP
jgi:hypothetical protein